MIAWYTMQSKQSNTNQFSKWPKWTTKVAWQMGHEAQCLKMSNHANTQIYKTMQVLAWVDKAKYLWIIITEHFDWSPHINSIVTKANRCLGFIKRSISNCPHELRELAYLSLVRSQLEYACVVWDTYQIKDISNLEKV